MTNVFSVRVLGFSKLLEIEGARTAADYAGLLDAMDGGDVTEMSDEELREMCIMSLQELEPLDAAYLVLKHDMGDVLRDGQARNVAGEMREEKLWAEYVDSTLHERLFNVGSLLYAAFPRIFPKPDAARVRLEISADNAGARAELTDPPHASLLVRLLADGMESSAILRRLYHEELAGKSFPNADEIAWIVVTESVSEHVMRIDVTGSCYWLDPLEDTQSYESNAYADDAAP
jgi:hypothetical protein